jgi:mono/diheme cytochrome c family protein
MMDGPEYKPEIDWQEVLKKPTRLFGFSYFYLLAVLVILGLLYVGNLDTIGKNAVRPVLLNDSAASIQDIPLQSPRIIPPVDVMKIGISSPELVEKGRELYKNNCAACHGDNGRGDGPSASMLNPKPRNFYSRDGWKNGTKIVQMYKTLQEGIPGSSMASYDYLPLQDRFALIHFIRTFSGKRSNDSQDELKQLDADYDLSKGMNIDGQIPVKKAVMLVAKENASEVQEIQKSVEKLSGSTIPETELLTKVIFDKQKMFTSFRSMQSSVKNLDDFIRIISADPLQAGFKVHVVLLSNSEWIELYHYAMQLSQRKRTP